MPSAPQQRHFTFTPGQPISDRVRETVFMLRDGSMERNPRRIPAGEHGVDYLVAENDIDYATSLRREVIADLETPHGTFAIFREPEFAAHTDHLFVDEHHLGYDYGLSFMKKPEGHEPDFTCSGNILGKLVTWHIYHIPDQYDDVEHELDPFVETAVPHKAL